MQHAACHSAKTNLAISQVKRFASITEHVGSLYGQSIRANICRSTGIIACYVLRSRSKSAAVNSSKSLVKKREHSLYSKNAAKQTLSQKAVPR